MKSRMGVPLRSLFDLRIHHPAHLDDHVFLSGCVFSCGPFLHDGRVLLMELSPGSLKQAVQRNALHTERRTFIGFSGR